MSIEQAKAAANAVNERAYKTLDAYYPPSRRNEHYNGLQAWVQEHPILAAFIITQLVFSGGPVLFFLFFATTVFAVTTLVALFISLVITFAIIGGVGLLLLPVLFITTAFATGFFLFGLTVYTAAHKFSTDPRTESIRNNAKDKYNTAVQSAQQTSQHVTAQTQQAALNAAGKINEVSNGQLEKSLADGKKALESQRANGQTQVPTSVPAHSSKVYQFGQPAPANLNDSKAATPHITQERPLVPEARASSRPALF